MGHKATEDEAEWGSDSVGVVVLPIEERAALSALISPFVSAADDRLLSELWSMIEVAKLIYSATAHDKKSHGRQIESVISSARRLRSLLHDESVRGELRPRLGSMAGYDRLTGDLDDLLRGAGIAADAMKWPAPAWPHSALNRAVGHIADAGVHTFGIKRELRREGVPSGPLIDFVEAVLGHLRLSIGRDAIMKAIYDNRRIADEA